MKLPSLKSILESSKETIDAMIIVIKEKQLRAKANLECAKIEEAILAKEAKITKTLKDDEISFSNLLDDLDELELLERRKKQYDDVISQLFPTTTGKTK